MPVKKLVKPAKKRIVKLARTLRVFSRHPTHSVLRRSVINTAPHLVCIRFGSETQGTIRYKVEINSPQSVRNSANKLLMKQCFDKGNVKTAIWERGSTLEKALAFVNANEYPIVMKSFFGSRGNGNTLIHNEKDLRNFATTHTLANYVCEKFYNYNREYRLHITEEGCFYTCRKMLKSDTPDDKKWFRNDSNSVWVIESNDQFDKPVNWNDCINESVKALKSVGLDVGAVDLRIQSASSKIEGKRKRPDFIVIEINSAPSFGEITSQKYIEEIPKIINYKLRTNKTNF